MMKNNVSYILVFLSWLFLNSILAEVSLPKITNKTCTTDNDCNLLNSLIPGWSTSTKTAGYLCVLQTDGTGFSKCTYKVGAGEICNVPRDCAVSEYITRGQIGMSGYKIPSEIRTNVSNYISGLCSPQYCTIQSTCDSFSDPLFSSVNGSLQYPFPSSSTTCCAGALDAWPCAKLGEFLDTCETDEVCTSNSSSGTQTCISVDAKSQQWIGIVLTLVGAATLNIGLNLQKLALRKRNEQNQEKKAVERIKFRSLVLGKFKLPKLGKRSNNGTATSFQKKIYNNKAYNIDPSSSPPIDSTPSASGATTLVAVGQPLQQSRYNGTTPGTYLDQQAEPIAQLQEDDIHLQKTLNFGSLLRNPTWILGLGIFIGGNVINFVALQFAPQSLVAPLGSISLVVNVIVAPWINNERWSWKDIVGVIMIVGGSSIVVAFSGYAAKNYKLCVLLQLFAATETIIYLTITGALLVIVFLLIVIVEKNVDFGITGITARALQDEIVPPYDTLVGTSRQNSNSDLSLQSNSSFFNSRDRLSRGGNKQPTTRSYGIFNQRPSISAVKITDPSTNTNHTVASNSIDKDKTNVNNTNNLITGDRPSAYGTLLSPTASSINSTVMPSSNIAAIVHEFESLNNGTSSIRLQEGVKSPGHMPKYPLLVRELCKWWRSIHIVPRIKNKIPLSSPWVVIALPFAYASLGGLMGTITVLFAKSTSYLLNISLGGNNQFNNVFAFLITGITIVTAIAQVYWINMGLQRYDALLQIPVYFVVWTLFDVVGGGIYFKEFKGFTSMQYVLFITGIGVIFAGVIVLADRLKKIEVDDRMIGNARIGAIEHFQDQEMISI